MSAVACTYNDDSMWVTARPLPHRHHHYHNRLDSPTTGAKAEKTENTTCIKCCLAAIAINFVPLLLQSSYLHESTCHGQATKSGLNSANIQRLQVTTTTAATPAAWVSILHRAVAPSCSCCPLVIWLFDTSRVFQYSFARFRVRFGAGLGFCQGGFSNWWCWASSGVPAPHDCQDAPSLDGHQP